MSRKEKTQTEEKLTNEVIHSRALEEVTQAVALEHLLGGTDTASNTATLAMSAVGSAALAGGLAAGAGAAVGAGLGAAIGTAFEPGAGTLIGLGIGAGIGFVGGGAIGAAGSMVYSSSQLLGTIHSESMGDRTVEAEMNQRINQRTKQNSDLKQSLFSTVVLDDAQAEEVNAKTRNITNYNHMHALNILYYEVLQHYLVRTRTTRLEPLIYIPYRFMDFTGFNYIRDYWDVVREFLKEPDLQQQGDLYFASEYDQEDRGPDLLPVPPMPVPPNASEPPTVSELKIELMFSGTSATSLDVKIKKSNGDEISAKRGGSGPMNTGVDIEYANGRWFEFSTISNAQEIIGIDVKASNPATDLTYKLRIATADIKSGSIFLEKIRARGIDPAKTFTSEEVEEKVSFTTWEPAEGYVEGDNAAHEEYEKLRTERQKITKENELRQQSYEVLRDKKERFLARLQMIVWRRKHALTRVILNAMEPEEIKDLLDKITVYDEECPNDQIPLYCFAHTRPIGMTAGAFVLKLKRVADGQAGKLPPGMPQSLSMFFRYARTVARWETDALSPDIDSTEHVYLPTGGLFAEAILGRSNGAEYLNLERHFNWQDTPIPHQPPAINPLSLDSRHQQQPINVTEPKSSLTLINPPQFPEPTGMAGVLAAIQNGTMFRDMSKASELAGILGNLMSLSGQMGQASTQLTGDAAKEAMKSAVQMGDMAAKIAQNMFEGAMTQASNMTKQGASLNALKKELPKGPGLEKAIKEILGVPSGVSETGADDEEIIIPGNTQGEAPVSTETVETGGSENDITTNLPDLPEPGKVPNVAPQPSPASKKIKAQVKELLNQGEAPEKPKLVEFGQEWYDKAVLPRLKQARNDDRFLAPALQEWLDWLGNMATLGVDSTNFSGPPSLADAENEAKDWVVAGLRNAILQAQERSIQTNKLEYLADAINWSAQAELFGLVDSGNRLGVYEVIEDFPLYVDIFDIQYPPKVPVDEAVSFSAKGALQITENPHLFKPSLVWEIAVEGGTLSGLNSGETNTYGGFSTVITRTSHTDFKLTIKVTFMDGAQPLKKNVLTFEPKLPD